MLVTLHFTDTTFLQSFIYLWRMYKIKNIKMCGSRSLITPNDMI